MQVQRCLASSKSEVEAKCIMVRSADYGEGKWGKRYVATSMKLRQLQRELSSSL
jgi:hypothetical protein